MNKRIVSILSAIMISAAVLGCGTQTASTAGSTKKATTVRQATQGESEKKSTIVESTKKETEKPQKNGFSENTKEYTIGSIKFEIPSYFSRQESNNSDTSAINNGDATGIWILEENHALFLAGGGNYASEPTMNEILTATKKLFNEDPISVENSVEQMIDGHSGGQFVLQVTENDKMYTCTETYVYDENNSKIYLLMLIVDPEAEYSYTDDYSKIVDSIKFVNTDANVLSQSADSSAVTPELKEFLDSYESFMDEYVAFMNKYKENPSDLELLSQYSDYLNKYTDFMQKANEYGDNEDEMSTADLNYYLEVTNRVNQKLLQAAADGTTE